MNLFKPQQIQNITRRCACRNYRHISTLHTRYLRNSNSRFHRAHASILESSITLDKSTSRPRQRQNLVSQASKSNAYWTEANLRDNGVFDDRNLLRFETLHELQVHASTAFPENKLFGTHTEREGSDPTFQWMTYREYGEQVERCRSVLKDLGVEEFSKVGIIANNCWEWATIAAAAYSLNATLVPMYEAQLPSDWTYITNDAGCSVLFCATQEIYDRTIAEVIPQTPSVRATLCLKADAGEPHAFQTYMEAAADHEGCTADVIKPSPDDLANLIYTSGTTGKPKGVELVHSNTVSNVTGVREMTEDVHDFIRQSDRSLAFLPWAHSYGQTCELWVGMAHGVSMGICRGVPLILEDLQLVKPTVLFAVPTLHKKIYDGVHNLIESASPVQKSLMKKALALGRRNVEEKNGGVALSFLEKIQYRALDEIILSKIRARFGGNLRHGFVAGAVCPSEVINFMDNVGIPIYEGYGLTETSPIITINSPDDRNPGFVGKSIKGVNVIIISEDGSPARPGVEGEICCYGPNIMRGYYNNAAATEEVISLAPDGKSRLFHTGDLGRMTVEGWVKVTGRLKEQYKLDNGKYVCPTPIEEAIGMSRFITQIVLCGANRPFNTALIAPDFEAIRSELRIDQSVSIDELVCDTRVQALIDTDIVKKCSGLKKYEIPREWAFVAPFTASNNMLTPKMSIRRHIVVKEYEDVIAQMYGNDNTIVNNMNGEASRLENRVA